MAIDVTCDGCGKTLQAKDQFAGSRVPCPNCGRELTLPGDPSPYAAPKFGPIEYAPDARTSGKAIASMILGILAFPVMCGSIFTGIPAMILGVLSLGDISRARGRLKGRGLATTGLVTGGLGVTVVPILGILIALLLPAVQAAREAARRAQCMNNLKQIGLAMANYESTYGVYPPPMTTDPQGRPLLSWRVLVLPYMEASELYNEFRLDEPWDSPHNRPLLDRMPVAFACPSDPQALKPNTTYQVIAGPGALFDASQTVRLSDVRDGTSNTLAVVESSIPVPWTQPRDLPFNPDGPLPPVGSKHPGGFNALFADGAVLFLKSTTAPETLRALITRDGGEVVMPK